MKQKKVVGSGMDKAYVGPSVYVLYVGDKYSDLIGFTNKMKNIKAPVACLTL